MIFENHSIVIEKRIIIINYKLLQSTQINLFTKELRLLILLLL